MVLNNEQMIQNLGKYMTGIREQLVPLNNYILTEAREWEKHPLTPKTTRKELREIRRREINLKKAYKLRNYLIWLHIRANVLILWLSAKNNEERKKVRENPIFVPLGLDWNRMIESTIPGVRRAGPESVGIELVEIIGSAMESGGAALAVGEAATSRKL
jgi:hypothetical protein